MKADTDEAVAFNRLYQQAIKQLAVRERSQLELKQKLSTLSHDTSLIDSVLNQLIDENLQSDDRYTEVYVRSYQRKGHGPLKIQQALMQKGVSRALIDEYVSNPETPWMDCLTASFEKKYTQHDFQDVNKKAKIYRFFQGKGFPLELIKRFETYHRP